jgi:hypothetical protein
MEKSIRAKKAGARGDIIKHVSKVYPTGIKMAEEEEEENSSSDKCSGHCLNVPPGTVGHHDNREPLY